jgi:hypothetical protein
MNRAFCLALLPLFFCLAAALPAWGKKESTGSAMREDQSTLVQVSGRVRLVGSNPFPDLVITGPDREWYIDRDDQHILKDLQHRTVTVEGNETVMALTFANGRPAGERRTLKNIRIIRIE